MLVEIMLYSDDTYDNGFVYKVVLTCTTSEEYPMRANNFCQTSNLSSQFYLANEITSTEKYENMSTFKHLLKLYYCVYKKKLS